MEVAIPIGEPNNVIAPADIEKRLIDGDPFDERREVAEHRHDLIAETLVLVEVAADEAQAGAQLAARRPDMPPVTPNARAS